MSDDIEYVIGDKMFRIEYAADGNGHEDVKYLAAYSENDAWEIVECTDDRASDVVNIEQVVW